MAKPVIMVVDDDPQVLNAVVRDLRGEFGREHQIVRAASGAEALETAQTLQKRGTQVALFLSDQRMPEMSGVEFLAEAGKIYPTARKVLLTAYADTEVAIDAINRIDLDYYMMKPWDPASSDFSSVLTDFLDEWRAGATTVYGGIRVAGTLWSARSHEVKDLLARSRVPYRWLDIERDPDAAALVRPIIGDALDRLPIVFFPEGEPLVAPEFREVAERVGLHTEAATDLYDLVIVGGGPAGLGAAVNGAAEGLKTLLVEREATGGQAGTSSRIENYLGFPRGISGSELAQRAHIQAERLGAEVLLSRKVVGIRVEGPFRYVELSDGSEIATRAVVIATGMSVRRLRAEGVDRLTGAGVYYGAALTEAAYYHDQPVVIVGGANSAGQAAMLYARHASSVTLIVRAASLSSRMSHYLQEQIGAVENITVRLRCEVRELHGDERLEAITIESKDDGVREKLPAAAMAIFIGAAPHTEFVADLVERTGAGFLLTGRDLWREGRLPDSWELKRQPYQLETSVPGVFAAGDVRFGSQPRVAAAVGAGGTAVGQVVDYLQTV